MIGVKYTVVPDGDIAMDEIAVFETDSYYGFYSDELDSYIILAKEDTDFNVAIMPENVNLDNLYEMNQWMINQFNEAIIGVSKHSPYKIVLED